MSLLRATQPSALASVLASVLAYGMVALFAANTADAQERQTLKTVDQRLARVERVLDQSLLSLSQRIDALQREVRVLSGEVESLQHELGKQQQRNRDLYQDTDQRIGEVERQQRAFAAGDVGDVGDVGDFLNELDDDFEGGLDETLDETQIKTPEVEVPVGASDEVGENTPRFVAPNSGELVVSSANDPLAPRVPVRANTTRAATQEEKSAYSNAYNLLAAGDSSGAISAFDAFLRQYPAGPFSDNAWYWQGEAHYAVRAFDSARKNFSIVVNSFPESAKVSDARLKIGYAMYEQGDFVTARQVLTSVQNDYPGRSASVLARKRLQKMNRDNQ